MANLVNLASNIFFFSTKYWVQIYNYNSQGQNYYILQEY